MKISDDTQNVIDFLSNYSGNTLRKTKDLAVIFEISADRMMHEELSELIFHGTAVYKMGTKILKRQSESDNMDNFRKEFTRSYEIMTTLIKSIIDEAENSVTRRFNDIYLAETDGTIRNLIDLGYDFSVFKAMQRESRQKSQE